jgi:transposase
VIKLKPSPIAEEALSRIGALYDIENRIRGMSADERRTLRQEHARPVLDELKAWIETTLSTLPQKQKLAEAMRYALSRWAALSVYIDDGRVEIDNNIAERAMRPLGRHVSLCATSLSVCKHWKRVRVDIAQRATFSGNRRFDRFGRQVGGPDLIGRSRNHLDCRKNAGGNEASHQIA